MSQFTKFYNYPGLFRYLRFGQSIRKQLDKSAPALSRFLESTVQRRKEKARWRRMGLRTDDMILDDNDVVVEALKRVPREEYYGRYNRFKIALHQDLLRRELPQEQWITNEQDKSYLLPFVEQVLSEHDEQAKYNSGLFLRA